MRLNQVFQSVSTQRKYRVVFEHIDFYMLIDVDDQNAWPILVTQEEFNNSDYQQIEDPFILPSVDNGSVQQVKRDEAYQTIAPLLNSGRALFDKKKRNELVGSTVRETGKPRIYIIRNLRRYWQRGLSPNALVPDYDHCGGKGKARRNVSNKLGRTRKILPGTGAIITDEIADVFRLVIEGFYLTSAKVPLTHAKDKANGILKSLMPGVGPSELPTFDQFRRFFNQNYKQSEVIQKRTPSRIYNKDIRPLVSTATAYNFGPGARYEIDATIADIYLVSDRDPDLIIGRPVVYLVKDVFSRMITGMYVGLENPSWVAASIALANAFTSKVDYCRHYGIAIEASQWPSVGIPASILADRGELLFRQADVLVNRFGIQVSNSRAYRGDDKAVCERHFNTIQTEFKPYAEGIVEPVNGKKRAGRRYELDAELGLSAFTEIMINLVIRHNNTHVISDYDFAQDMPENLPAIPIQLWNWGIKHRTGQLKPCDDRLVRINLLPSEKGTVSEVGITYRGLRYTCQEALSQGWFDRYKQTRPSRVEIAFDPRKTDTVYLRPDSSYEKYWECELSDHSRRYRDLSFAEAGLQLKMARATIAEARQIEAFHAPDIQSTIEKIVQRERKKKPSAPSKSAAERLRGIRDNRDRERDEERKRTSIQKKPNPDRGSNAQVIDIRTKKETRSNMDYPDLDQFLGDNDD